MVEFTTSLLTTATINTELNKLDQIDELTQQKRTDTTILSTTIETTNTPTLPKNHSQNIVSNSDSEITDKIASISNNCNSFSNTKTSVDNSYFSDLELISVEKEEAQQQKQQIEANEESSSQPKLDQLVNQFKAAINSIGKGRENYNNSELTASSSGIISSIKNTNEAFLSRCDNNESLNFIKNLTKEDITNSEIFKSIQDFFHSGNFSKSSDIKSKVKILLGLEEEEENAIGFAQKQSDKNINRKQQQQKEEEKSEFLHKLQQQQPLQPTSSGYEVNTFQQQGDQNLITKRVAVRSEDYKQQNRQLEYQEEVVKQTNTATSAEESFVDASPLVSNSTNNYSGDFDSVNDLNFQLRALNERNISSSSSSSSPSADPWSIGVPQTLPNNIQVSTLSTELVNETLNYFVNCRQRLSQMTKTYDDNDAYIYLLQEKEVDLELAARIGQDLLKQNKKLKENVEQLECELAKRQDDVQQLRHELNSKITLLDTFIEEEQESQHHNSFAAESEDELTFKQTTSDNQQYSRQPATSTAHIINSHDSNQNKGLGNNNLIHQNQQRSVSTSFEEDDCCSNGFLSLNAHQRPASVLVEPFSSLPHYLATSESRQQLLLSQRDETSSVCTDTNEINDTKQRLKNQEVLNQTVTFQLVESNKRLCELQDELFYKCEQNLMKQENIYRLQEQLKETERRLCDFASENELLQKTLQESSESQKEICDELQVYKRNFSELLRVFLELQKESRYYKNTMQSFYHKQQHDYKDSQLNFIIEPILEERSNNVSFDFFNTTTNNNNNNNNVDIDVDVDNASKAKETTKKNKNNTINNNNNYETLFRNSCATKASHDHNQTSSSSFSNNNDKNFNNDSDDNRYVPTASVSLFEEIQSVTRDKSKLNFSSMNSADEGDSGVHTNTTPVANRSNSEDTHTDSEESTTSSTSNTKSTITTNSFDGNEILDKSKNKQHHDQQQNKRTWLGLSSFMITTILILYLSVTLSSPPNLTVSVPKLQLSKLTR